MEPLTHNIVDVTDGLLQETYEEWLGYVDEL